MKDLPHHMKKLNRRVIRSMHREEMEEEALPDIPRQPDSKAQQKKKAKQAMKRERDAHIPRGKSPEERNKEMKGGRHGRVPVFDQNKGTVKKAPLPKKKTPRI